MYCSKCGTFGNDLHFPSGEILWLRSLVDFGGRVVVGFGGLFTTKTIRDTNQGYNGHFSALHFVCNMLTINLVRL